MSWRFCGIIAYILTFSSAYALFEIHSSPCSILPWCGYIWDGMNLYQYGFMLPLFSIAAILPVRRSFVAANSGRFFALALFFIAVIAEDVMYFVFSNQPIVPGLYTTQWGYFSVSWLVIPTWYIAFGLSSACAFFLSRKAQLIDARFERYWANRKALNEPGSRPLHRTS
jgi:hypothetical protein